MLINHSQLVLDWIRVLAIAVKDEGRFSNFEELSGVVWVWKRVVLMGIVISRYMEG